MAIYTDYQNASLNLFVDQGTAFTQIVDLKDDIGGPLDLTGYTLQIQIKKYYNTSRTYPALVSFVGDPILGRIKIEIPKETNEDFDASRYVYRVLIVDIANPTTGLVTVLDGHILVDRF